MEHRLDDGQIEVVDEALAEVLRRKTPAERVAMAGDAWHAGRAWLQAVVASQHPEWSAAQVNGEVNRRLLGGAA